MKNCTVMIGDNVRIITIHRPDFILTLHGCFTDLKKWNNQNLESTSRTLAKAAHCCCGLLATRPPSSAALCRASLLTQTGVQPHAQNHFIPEPELRSLAACWLGLHRPAFAPHVRQCAVKPPTPTPWPCLWSYLGYPDAKRSSQIAAFPWSGWSRAALSLFPVYFQEFYQWHTMHSPCLKVLNSHVQLSSVKRTGFKAILALTLWLRREMDMQACLMCWKLHLKWT